MKKRLLIVSFSPIHRDPRVLRQVDLFRHDYDVVTCGYGSAPEGVVDHIQVPDHLKAWRASKLQALALYASRSYRALYSGAERTRVALAGIQARPPFAGVIANDVLALPLATRLGVPVHADLHEYAMGQGTGTAWKLTTGPLLKWAAKSIRDCASVTTVAPGIAARYEREYGRPVGVVPNSPAYRDDMAVHPTSSPIRLVHVGAGSPDRSLDLAIEAVQLVNAGQPGSLEFDLYLVPGSRSHIEELRVLAGDGAVTGVRLREPVEFSQLVGLINSYDVGVHFIPPVSYNVKHALPNKFFEYVQARVGMVIGPSVEMAPYVDKYGFGAVANGWGADDLADTLRALSPGVVDGWKARSDGAARELSAEVTSQAWVDAVTAMMERQP
ncbi:MAG: hypothetical protein ACOX61_08825 [Brooklawnia sp.]|jgi:hypothetical protein